MSQLRGSPNYVWSLMDVLGQGATGAVYRARNRKSGECYAVKTFNHLSQMRPVAVQMREFEVLKKLNHDNIVRLIAIEEETSTRSKVLIMELCTGGSLYNMLDKPESAFGIPEKEFFRVLDDVASGMKHVRDQGIIHRDIKPGNIMRYIDDKGRSIYKLTDFGAARELQEEEEFMSLYGTEEYLYPDMYERAVLRRPSSKMFDASVDLWSVGVTLFHVATGQLPFRPYGGRKNKEMMFRITREKQSGVISGYQETDNGPIKWSRDLPTNCQLSIGARRLVRPLLAGLMETDANHMWSFDTFFCKVKEIVDHEVLYVFSLCQCEMLHVFLKPNDSLMKLHDNLASQTNIQAKNQRLFFENSEFSQFVSDLQPVSSYPKTDKNSPIFLFYNEQSDMPLQPDFNIPPLPPLTPANQFHLEYDAEASKSCINNMILTQRQISTYIHNQLSLSDGVSMFLHVLKQQLDHMVTYVQKFMLALSETEKRLKIVLHASGAAPAELELSSRGGRPTDAPPAMQSRFYELKNAVSEMQISLHRCNEIVAEYQSLTPKWGRDMECSESDYCESKIRVIVEEVRQTYLDFKRDLSLKKLSHNETQIHKFEKHKMGLKCRTGRALAEKHCHPNLSNMFQKFVKWYSGSYRVSQQLKMFDSRILILEDTHTNLIRDIDKLQSECLKQKPSPSSTFHAVGDTLHSYDVLPLDAPKTLAHGSDLRVSLLDQLKSTLSQVETDSKTVEKTLSDGFEFLSLVEDCREMNSNGFPTFASMNS